VLSHLLTSLLTASGPVVYVTVALLAFGETALLVGLVLPGETALLVGGVIAGRGGVGLWQILAVAALAAIGGDSVGYLLGRTFGPAIAGSRAGRWIGPARWARAESYLARRGGAALLWCRWVGVLRAMVPTVAGVGRMPYRTFLSWNVAGGLSWVGTVIGLGYLFSGSVDALLQAATRAAAVTTALVVALAAAALARRFELVGRVRRAMARPARDHLSVIAGRGRTWAGRLAQVAARLPLSTDRRKRHWVPAVGLIVLAGGLGVALAV